MKPQELNKKELTEINGGNTNESSVGLSGTVSTDSLLAIETSYANGDRSGSNKLSVGNGINLDLAAITNNLTK
ncbi:MAG: bacteriocin [Pedobacter sp.]|nr:MAG: bacteriocin [Pedobacter sp.]